MRILAFADMHGSEKALREVKNKGERADLVLCCGDLTIFEQNLKRFLRELNRLKKPILIIPGNHETAADMREASSSFANIVFMDGKAFDTEDILFLGAEGNGFGIIDKHFDKLAKRFQKVLKKGHKESILMTHAPPYKTRLDKLIDGHCGNRSIRNFILKTKPKYAFSGHIHENSGKKDKLGKTIVMNPGPYGTIVKI